ncbi:hypothetical protein EDB86DRAFT_2828934 [Lactarius hatsudake]|nr:hypothetical protein EDB86DRAFT_2828934 [Lactarius hatsudake]
MRLSCEKSKDERRLHGASRDTPRHAATHQVLLPPDMTRASWYIAVRAKPHDPKRAWGLIVDKMKLASIVANRCLNRKKETVLSNTLSSPKCKKKCAPNESGEDARGKKLANLKTRSNCNGNDPGEDNNSGWFESDGRHRRMMRSKNAQEGPRDRNPTRSCGGTEVAPSGHDGHNGIGPSGPSWPQSHHRITKKKFSFIYTFASARGDCKTIVRTRSHSTTRNSLVTTTAYPGVNEKIAFFEETFATVALLVYVTD